MSRTLDGKGNILTEKFTGTVLGSGSTTATSKTITVSHSYTPTGLRKSTSDGRGNTTRFQYDDLGLLILQTEPEGSTTGYVNDKRGRQTNMTDPKGHEWQYEYDGLDRVLSVNGPQGYQETNTYDAKGNLLRQKLKDTYKAGSSSHTRQTTLTYDYDSRDRVIKTQRGAQTSGLSGSLVGGKKVFGYDFNSNITSETDWNGASEKRRYDALNRHIYTRNRLGHEMTVSYQFLQGEGLKKTITDYESRVITQYQDLLGRLVRETLPEVQIGTATEQYKRLYEYDNLTNLLKFTDEANRLTQYQYDARNLKIHQTNAEGDVFEWFYDENGNRVGTKDEEERFTRFSYDRQNRLTEKRQPEGHRWQYGYDANGNLTSTIDPWGFTTSTTYDGNNQPSEITHPDGKEQVGYTKDGLQAYRKDAEGRENLSLYTVDQRLIRTRDGRGREGQRSYDHNGNLTQQVSRWNAAETGPTEVTTRFQYDAINQLKETQEPGRTIQYEYDKVGNQTRVRYPEGRETRTSYDALNRPIVVTDAQNKTTKTRYDEVGNPVRVENRRGFAVTTTYDNLNRPDIITDSLNQILDNDYDKVGNLVAVTDKRGTKLTHVYDGLNRLVSSHKKAKSDEGPIRLVLNDYDIDMDQGRKNKVTDANNHATTFTLDWRGNTIKTELPVTEEYPAANVMTNEFDNAGQLVKETDAHGLTTSYEYFPDNALSQQTNAENEITAYEYDLFGNQAKVTLPMQQETTYTYDALSRLILVTDALSNSSRFEYDPNDNLLHQYTPGTDGPDSHVEYRYDTLNRKTAHIQYKGGGNLSTTYEYDEEGNLTKVVDAKGQIFSNQYDALNRLTQQEFPENSDIDRIVHAYDANNNLTQVTESKTNNLTEITSYGYDLLDRLIQTTQRGHPVSYVYDNNGNRTQVSSANGTTTYGYDTRNRLKTATADGQTTTYKYLPNSWKEQVIYPNQTQANYSYDQVGRVTAIRNETEDGALLSGFSYTYDDNGNRTEQQEVQNGFSTSQQHTTTYTYDDLNRLESYTQLDEATGNSKETAYTFYPSYDRATETVTTTTDGDASTTQRQYQYDETYWLIDITDPDDDNNGKITYAYDANGNTVQKVDTLATTPTNTEFQYNSRNMLVKVTRGPPGNLTDQGRYDYNYQGMRIRHLGSERGDIEYLYDDRSILEERINNTSTLVAHYRYADRLVSLTTPTDTQYYHYASLGTTANLTDPQGQIAMAYRTDPYGEITKQEGNSVNRQVFTGQEHDENTGLIYFGARFYDPDVGRFINQDTYLGESSTPPSLHRYLYAYANPTVWVDLDGNLAVTEDDIDSVLRAERGSYFDLKSSALLKIAQQEEYNIKTRVVRGARQPYIGPYGLDRLKELIQRGIGYTNDKQQFLKAYPSLIYITSEDDERSLRGDVRDILGSGSYLNDQLDIEDVIKRVLASRKHSTVDLSLERTWTIGSIEKEYSRDYLDSLLGEGDNVVRSFVEESIDDLFKTFNPRIPNTLWTKAVTSTAWNVVPYAGAAGKGVKLTRGLKLTSDQKHLLKAYKQTPIKWNDWQKALKGDISTKEKARLWNTYYKDSYFRKAAKYIRPANERFHQPHSQLALDANYFNLKPGGFIANYSLGTGAAGFYYGYSTPLQPIDLPESILTIPFQFGDFIGGMAGHAEFMVNEMIKESSVEGGKK